MTDKNKLEINIKVNKPEDKDRPSPTFGGSNTAQQVAEGMQKVGKHGKSHHSYMKVASQYKPPKELRKITLD